jgi:amino acid transporter
VLNNPNYVPKQWHGTLLTLAILIVAIIFNTVLVRKLPLLESVFVFIHILGVVVCIPVLVLIPKTTGGSPLIDFFNPNGWMSNGVVTVIGMVPVVLALIGFDSPINMSELPSPVPTASVLFLTFLLQVRRLKTPPMPCQRFC